MQDQCYPFLSVCATHSYQCVLPIPISVCYPFLSVCATHSYQCVLPILISVCYPFLSVCATHSYQCVLPIPISVQYFHGSEQGYGCQCLEFLMCAQILMHAIAHRSCMDTIRVSALDVDSGRKKIPCCTRDSNPCQYCIWLFGMLICTLYPLKSVDKYCLCFVQL